MLLSSSHPSVVGQSDESERVLAELESILQSEYFCRSRQSSAFLHFVVEQTLQGNSHLLKERTIAIFVFGKCDRYDTSVDAFVRVRANEVRRRLASYYGSKTVKSLFRIELSPGRYVPRFVGAKEGGAPSRTQEGILASMLNDRSSIQMSLEPLSVELLNAVLPIIQVAFASRLPVTFNCAHQPSSSNSLGICIKLDPAVAAAQLIAHREPPAWFVVTAATAEEAARFINGHVCVSESSNRSGALVRASTFGLGPNHDSAPTGNQSEAKMYRLP